jgi:hypothetical protein
MANSKLLIMKGSLPMPIHIVIKYFGPDKESIKLQSYKAGSTQLKMTKTAYF